ncbi:MAG TPA: YggS family pyridoxal phosphate-dependent enzyme [Acidimicrobiales bacterium]|nr:YggS family pyridoxal phosphate-dependent enzyme [Acidimicrobiales bacterium]
MTAPAAIVADRLADVRRRVEASGGDPQRVRIVAVTKGFGPDAVEAAREAGLVDVGENYAQELLSKAPAARPGTRWHFLGPVQRNKVHRLAAVVSTWHGIDRPAAAEAVAAAAPGSEVMVQVNVIGDPGRPGCSPEEVEELVARIRELPLDLSGLMAVGPADIGERSRECFRWLAGRAAQLGLRELSMGMSDDFEMAVAEGATTLRLGRVLFGARPERTVQRR